MTSRVRALAVALLATVLTLAGVAAATAATPRPVVEVRGSELVDVAGGEARTLQLRGVNRSGTETACAYEAGVRPPGEGGYAIFDGPTYNSYDPSRPNVPSDVVQPDSSIEAMQRWGINAVRIPLSDACWFGDPALNRAYSGTRYQTAIADYVDQLARHGIVAILSLHIASTTVDGAVSPNFGPRLLPMPDAVQGPRFWKDVVQRMGSALPTGVRRRESIVYDLYNEPHLDARDGIDPTTGWDCWRDGCEVNTVDARTDPPATADSTPAYRTAGMTDLVRAVRGQERDTGSPVRPIMLGGLDYANDLSGWSGHLPTSVDGDGRRVVYPGLVGSFHAYGSRRDADGSVARQGTLCADEACWTRTLGAVRDAGRPVVTGEIGQYDCRADFTRRFTAWADGEGTPDEGGISYLAWTWNAMRRGDASGDPATTATGWACDDGPSLIRFNDGTPTRDFGLGYCQWLRARAGLPGDGSANPCPADRAAAVPPALPADATPVAPPTTTPPVTTPPVTTSPTTTPASPSGPTTPAPTPTPDPGPFSPPVTVPVTPTAPVVPPMAGPAEPRNVRVTSPSLRLRRGKVALKVVCTAGRTRCTGRIRVRTASRVALGRRRAVLVVLSVGFDVPAGRTATLTAAPTGDGRKLLRSVRRVKTVATVTSAGDLPGTKRLTLAR
ncbi:glycoside hydrolase family 5 protein [Patulibacter sp.]|uniref:glycoside hydrolase family 5 protein n=1 Tax=Patulibacter sp. TaxID=1912859 RepID=UPI002728610E|nr:cellulase family glycosylhydrolase [Patulibacter sp.]MDO9410002.1 cellulase family glycosylhydrolase [Patulibacter sp.]